MRRVNHDGRIGLRLLDLFEQAGGRRAIRQREAGQNDIEILAAQEPQGVQWIFDARERQPLAIEKLFGCGCDP